MATVFDVAAYILKRCGSMSAMKLQKLVYYSQAWSLVWDDEPLFQERIEAWVNGPVIPDLYERHRGEFKVTPEMVNGDTAVLTETQKETVNAVCDACCELSAQQLSDMTHSEAPWQDARKGLRDGERGHNEITHEAMSEYYSSLSPQNE